MNTREPDAYPEQRHATVTTNVYRVHSASAVEMTFDSLKAAKEFAKEEANRKGDCYITRYQLTVVSMESYDHIQKVKQNN